MKWMTLQCPVCRKTWTTPGRHRELFEKHGWPIHHGERMEEVREDERSRIKNSLRA